jgi:hypothetical protein
MRHRRAAPSDLSQWDCEIETAFPTEDNDKVGRFHQSSFLPFILGRLRQYYSYSSAPKRQGWQKLLPLLLLLFLVGGVVATVAVAVSFSSSSSRLGVKPMVSSLSSSLSSSSSSSYQPIQQSSSNSTTYDVFDCPATPPWGYPREYPILDVLTHWKTDNIDRSPSRIYQGICIFDFASLSVDHDTQDSSSEQQEQQQHRLQRLQHLQQQVRNYQTAEVPFVIRNDPDVLKAVTKWKDPHYLQSKLAGKYYEATLSNTTRMTYYSVDPEHVVVPSDFVPFTTHVPMSFDEWYHKLATTKRSTTSTTMAHPKSPSSVQEHKEAKNTRHHTSDYAYLRLDACLPDHNCDSTYRGDARLDNADFIYEDLSFFKPTTTTITTTTTTTSASSSSSHSSFSWNYNITHKSRGIQCRLGSPGMVAENHFDNERNWIAMLHGERRYLLGHPKNCPTMYLYPPQHPLERHTRLDWSQPNQYMYKEKDNNHPSDDDDNADHDSRTREFPNFGNTTINEIVLQAGDVLYLPTYWFHHIISLTVNYQCNTRSGYSVEYDQIIYDCGFFYDFPS